MGYEKIKDAFSENMIVSLSCKIKPSILWCSGCFLCGVLWVKRAWPQGCSGWLLGLADENP